MVTQLQDVSNTVAQEKISNQRLRNEEIRRQMANPWSEPKEPTTSGRQPLQDIFSNNGYAPTLASTYSGLLSNYQGMTGTSSNSGRTEGVYNQNTTGQTSSGNTTFGSPGITGRMPSWGPTVVGTGLSLAGAGIAAPIGAAATSLMRGDKAGAVSTLSRLFTNEITDGKVPGAAGVVSSLASGLVNGKSATEIGYDISNSLLGTGLGMVNPALGLGYNLARMFGLDVSRGISDYTKSDINQRFDAGYNGGFWGDRSWTPTAPYSPTNTYSGSGYGNTAGPGSGGYKGESSFGGYSPTMNYGSNSGSYWSGSSGSSSSGYPSSGSWSSYSSGSAYSSDSDSNSSYSNPASSYGGW